MNEQVDVSALLAKVEILQKHVLHLQDVVHKLAGSHSDLVKMLGELKLSSFANNGAGLEAIR